MEVKLCISQSEVYTEVAKTTGYVGAKMQGDEEAYDRIYTTDENKEILSRFWDESRAVAVGRLKGLVASEAMGDDRDTYTMELNLSSDFDTALQTSMELSLKSYFIQAIVAKWFVFTNNKDVEQFGTQATALLDDVREKAFHKKAPTRPTYTTDSSDTQQQMPTDQEQEQQQAATD